MITVTAAVLKRNNTVLAARRKSGSHMAGFWEFPGGKVEPGESEQQCLVRELQEEFNIICSIDSFFAESVYDYGIKIIKLRAYVVRHISGNFMCRDHDTLIWLAKNDLQTIQWAPADVPIVKKIVESANFFCRN